MGRGDGRTLKQGSKIPLRKNFPTTVVEQDGITVYFDDGLPSCEDGPAVITPEAELWMEQGQLHRESGPAVIHANGAEEYFHRGLKVPQNKPSKKATASKGPLGKSSDKGAKKKNKKIKGHDGKGSNRAPRLRLVSEFEKWFEDFMLFIF
jgi:hypothetical protein